MNTATGGGTKKWLSLDIILIYRKRSQPSDSEYSSDEEPEPST